MEKVNILDNESIVGGNRRDEHPPGIESDEQDEAMQNMQQKQNIHRLEVMKTQKHNGEATANDKAEENDFYCIEIYISSDYKTFYLDGDVEQLLPFMLNQILKRKRYVTNKRTKNRKKNEVEMVVSYAKRFLPAVFSNKHEQWVAMWQQIADNNDLQKLVFCSGKQNYKDFNKNGIAQIVGFLINEYPNLFSICTYSNISEIVEGSKKHHMRIELGRHKNINETNKKKIKEIYKQIYTDTK